VWLLIHIIKINKVINLTKLISLSFMTEEKNEQIQEEEELELPEVAEGEEDTTDWKELALKQQGINKRLKTKNEKLKVKKEEPKKEEKPPEKPDEKPSENKLTTGDKALLNSYKKIKGADEIALCENWMTQYKSTLEEMMEDEVFNNRLSKLREAKAVNDALPKSGKRSSSSDTSAVDFWINKPFEEVPKELKRDVLNAQLANEEKESMFGK